MKIKVTQMGYHIEDGRAIVDIWGRGENRNRVHLKLKGVTPKFWLDVEPRPHPAIRRVVKEGVNLLNKSLWKVETQIPMDVPEVRKHYPTHYEADILFEDRARYDCGIKSVIDVPIKEYILPDDISEAEGDIKPRYWALDIETSDSHGFADAKYPTAEVLSFALYDSEEDKVYACITNQVEEDKVRKFLSSEKWLKKHIQTEKKVEPFIGKLEIRVVKDEYRLFLHLVELFARLQPDFIIGWNVDGYDVPYITERAGAYSKRVVNKIPMKRQLPCPNFREVGVFDLMAGYKQLYRVEKGELDSKSLEFCASEELGYGKLKHEKGFQKMYDELPSTFLAYNIWDTVITERVNRKREILVTYDTRVSEAGTRIENAHHNSLLIDALFLHRLKGIVVLPSKTNLYKKKNVRGGYTHKPSKGLKKWVCVIDFKQQYPGGIRSCNMSTETLVSKTYEGSVYTVPSGNRYKKSPRGLLPMILDELSMTRDTLKKERDESEFGSPEYRTKDIKQEAYKHYMNSFYGVMATKKGLFRLTDNEVGYDIPDVARALTLFTIALLERNGIEVVYGDTDSCLIRFEGIDDPEEVLKKVLSLVKWLNKKYGDFAKSLGNTGESHYFHIDIDKIYEYYFQSAREKDSGETVGKKRYAGLLAWKNGHWCMDSSIKDRLVIKGYEVRRSDASPLTRKLQKKVIIMILTGVDKKEIREEIKKTIAEVYAGERDVELGIPKGLKSEVYGTKGAHVRAADYSNSFLGYNFQFGDKPIHFYGHIKDKPITDVFAIDWNDPLPEGAVINRELMVDKCIKKPIERIISGLGYTWSEFVEGKCISKQGSLDQWK